MFLVWRGVGGEEGWMGWVGTGGRCVKEANAPFFKRSSQALDSPANAPFFNRSSRSRSCEPTCFWVRVCLGFRASESGERPRVRAREQ